MFTYLMFGGFKMFLYFSFIIKLHNNIKFDKYAYYNDIVIVLKIS